MAGWRPRRANASAPRPLQDGTPDHLEQSLRAWVASHLTRLNSVGYRVLNDSVLRDWDLVSERRPLLPYAVANDWEGTWRQMSPDDRLDLVDWLAYRDEENPDDDDRTLLSLIAILDNGSSLWQVGDREGHAGLLSRVPKGAQEAADAAMDTPGDAGLLLSEAWSALYGRQKDAAASYDKAVKAVEAASTPVVKPTDSTASLSKVIGQMRSDGNWTIAFDKEHKQNPLDKVLLDMMQALMSGHSDRHPGTPGYVPTSQEAAVAAVGLAVTLVHWFASGAVKQIND